MQDNFKSKISQLVYIDIGMTPTCQLSQLKMLAEA